MNLFFLSIELLSYLFAAYLFWKKKDLALIYLPVLIFANNVIQPVFSASFYYATISALIISAVVRNGTFYKNNPYALLIFLYFLLLLTRSDDLVTIRPHVFSTFWLFLSIPLIAAVYKKHSAQIIFTELSTCAFLILSLFVANVAMSTISNYSPAQMYGISRGVLYGNIYAAGFNILSIATFIIIVRLMMNRNVPLLVLVIVAYALIMLSLRRSVMAVSTIGILIALGTLIFRKQSKQFIVLGSLIVLTGFFIYSNTGFGQEFKERYELRQLDDRELGNEPRLAEYDLILTDMFIYKAYNPLIGFGLFNSAGNYGKGIFELRSLHGDLPSLAHSSGIFGVILYCLMMLVAFRSVIVDCVLTLDRSIVLFAGIALFVFAGTGRFTESGFMILIFLVLMLPLAGKEKDLQISGAEATGDTVEPTLQVQ